MSDPTIYDNQRTGLYLLTRIEELTEGVSGDGHSWRHLLLACAAEMQRLTRRGDHYCEQAHEANRQLAECANRRAEVKRLCKSHNNPGSNPGAHKLAGDVLRILEDSE